MRVNRLDWAGPTDSWQTLVSAVISEIIIIIIFINCSWVVTRWQWLFYM